jgi:type I restriction enzyme M protein
MVDQANKDGFLEALTQLGGSAGNVRLRDTLQWDEEVYSNVKDALIESGAILTGRGRGGSVSLAVGDGGEVQARPASAPKPQKAKAAKAAKASSNSGGDLGFEADLFKAADKLRGNLEPSEYKHIALGLIFLKYISEAFEASAYAKLSGEDYADPEDPEGISRRQRVLGAAGSTLGALAGQCQAP